MTSKSRSDLGLKIMQISDDKNPHTAILFDYNKTEDHKSQKIWSDELALLQLKHKRLKIEVDERVPIHSRVEAHRWFLTKDKYGVVYIMLIADLFEEQYVFKLQNKIQQVLWLNYDDLIIGDENKLEDARIHWTEIVDQYNTALATNAQADCLISFQESNVLIQEKVGEEVNLAKDRESSFVDENECQVLMFKRNKRVLCLQVGTILAFTLIAVLELFVVMGFGSGNKA